MTPENYSKFLKKLSDEGFIVIAPKYNMHIFANLEDIREKTLKITDSLRKLYKLRNGCVGGHSLGGYVAIEIHRNFNCLVLLSPYFPVVKPIKSINIPTLIFSAGKDFLTPYTIFQRRIFDNVNAPKSLIFIDNATHNMYLDQPMFFDVIAGWPPIFQLRYYSTVSRYTIRFMDNFISGPETPYTFEE